MGMSKRQDKLENEYVSTTVKLFYPSFSTERKWREEFSLEEYKKITTFFNIPLQKNKIFWKNSSHHNLQFATPNCKLIHKYTKCFRCSRNLENHYSFYTNYGNIFHIFFRNWIRYKNKLLVIHFVMLPEADPVFIRQAKNIYHYRFYFSCLIRK